MEMSPDRQRAQEMAKLPEKVRASSPQALPDTGSMGRP